ncbi:MAG: hypothetical protein ACREJQ_01630, partial [bacterium]
MSLDLFSAAVGAILAILLMWGASYLYRTQVRRSLRFWVDQVKKDTKAAPPAELTDFAAQLRSLQDQIAEYEARAKISASESNLAAAHTRFLQTVLELSAWEGPRDELIRRLLAQLQESLSVDGVIYFSYDADFKGFRAALSSGAVEPAAAGLVLHPDQHPFFLRQLFTARGGVLATRRDTDNRFFLDLLDVVWAVITLLRKGGDLFGAVAAFGRQEVRDTDKRHELFRYYTDAISVLLENLDIRESINRRVQDLELLHEINLQISSILEFDRVLHYSVERVARAFQTEIATIDLLDVDVLHTVASSGLSLEFVRSLGGLKIGESLSGKVAVTGKPLV